MGRWVGGKRGVYVGRWLGVGGRRQVGVGVWEGGWVCTGRDGGTSVEEGGYGWASSGSAPEDSRSAAAAGLEVEEDWPLSHSGPWTL